MLEFGNRLKELRKSRNYTQENLANQLHISKSVISAYELSLRQPSYEILIKLAKTFSAGAPHRPNKFLIAPGRNNFSQN